MKKVSASEARANLYRLLDEVAETHKPVRIAGKRNNAVLVSGDDWDAMQETLYLLSIPGVRESLCGDMKTPAKKLAKDLCW
jgi:antitoxin YefM